MKKLTAVCALVLALTMALAPAAHAAEWADPTQVCYPSSVTQSEDGTEIRKFYDLSPEDDPTGMNWFFTSAVTFICVRKTISSSRTAFILSKI